MPTVRFRLTTDLPPDRVFGALIDFSDRRPTVWPNIDEAQFRVHAQGPGWADVTEGNVLAWERNRYDWNAGAGEVTVTAVESDTWHPGASGVTGCSPLPRAALRSTSWWSGSAVGCAEGCLGHSSVGSAFESSALTWRRCSPGFADERACSHRVVFLAML